MRFGSILVLSTLVIALKSQMITKTGDILFKPIA